MRKFFITVALAFSLTGCAGGLSTSVDNPITVRDLAAIEQSYKVALRPAVAYIELRTCSTSRPFTTSSPCGYYNTKITIQNAIREAQKWRRELSRFVKTNRQIDAEVAYRELVRALDTMSQARTGAL